MEFWPIETHLAHNLYAEVAQELGFVGLFLFMLYLFAIFKALTIEQKKWQPLAVSQPNFMQSSRNALLVFFYMNLLFSMASYGLSLYQWYLIPGLIVVLERIQDQHVERELFDSEQTIKESFKHLKIIH